MGDDADEVVPQRRESGGTRASRIGADRSAPPGRRIEGASTRWWGPPIREGEGTRAGLGRVGPVGLILVFLFPLNF
jgi:hypothetical protein